MKKRNVIAAVGSLLLGSMLGGCYRSAPPLEESADQTQQAETPPPVVSPEQMHPVVRKRYETTPVSATIRTPTPTPTPSVNTAPPALNGGDLAIVTAKNTSVSVTLATAAYSGSDELSYLLVSSPAHGSVSPLNSNPLVGGTAAYTPSSNYVGTDSFSYNVCSNTTQVCASVPSAVSVTVTAVNDAPSISSISNQATNEDIATSPVNFTIADPDSAVMCSQVVGSSGNVSLIEDSGIVIAGGASTSCTLSLNPRANANGNANITLSLSDSASAVTQTFSLTVNPINDAPTISSIGNQSTNVNLSATMAFTVSDADGPLACSSTYLSYSSASTSLVDATGAVSWSGTWPNCIARITPVANANGIVNLTFQISDTAVPIAGTASQSFQLTINDSLVAPPPVVTDPALASTTSSSAAFSISGTCVSGYTVMLAGNVAASDVNTGSLNQTCLNQSFGWTVNKTIEGNFTFQVTQVNPQDPTNTPSNPEFRYWTRDVTKPTIPILTSPIENPTLSKSGSFSIKGSCEPDATVSLTAVVSKAGLAVTPASTTCSLNGTFSISQNVGTTGDTNTDAIYTYSIWSTDLAGNSSATVSFVWDKNISYLSTPSISSVLINNSGSNALTSDLFVYTAASNDSLTINGTCDSSAGTTLAVTENGNPIASPPACSTLTNTFTLTIQSTSPTKWISGAETSWFYEIYNVDVNGYNSPKTIFTWLTDNKLPSAAIFTQPSVASVTTPNRLFISGTCATSDGNRGMVRFFINDAWESNWDAACATDNTFSTTIDKTGSLTTYTITAKHADPAGNLSLVSSTITWTQDPNSVPAPVVTSPTSTVVSNSDSLSLYGNCEPFYILTLSGASSATQTCAANGKFTISVSKSADATYSWNVSQQVTAGSTPSAAAVVTWTRDTAAPLAPTLSAGAGNPYSAMAYFTFSGADTNGGSGVTRYECTTIQSPTASDWSICTSPFLNWVNSSASVSTPLSVSGTKYFTVRSVDIAGNVGPAASTLSWTPTVNNAVLLHQFESNQSNSSSYAATSLNFTGSGTGLTYPTGKFGTALYFQKVSGSTYATASMSDNNYLSAFLSTMTIEFFLNVESNAKSFQIIGQTNSWSVSVVRGNNTTFHVSFTGFLNGATTSQTLQANCGFATGAWRYVAIRFNHGAVDLYCNSSVAKASAQWGVAGKARLNDSTSAVNLGSGSAGTFWNIDSLRISQGMRVISVPTQAFDAD